MAQYVLIETRDPFEQRDVIEYFWPMAGNLVKEGHEVTLFLVQNGVLPARQRNAHGGKLAELASGGVRVLADDFSLRERGIGAEAIVAGIAVAGIDALVDLIVEPGTRALWH